MRRIVQGTLLFAAVCLIPHPTSASFRGRGCAEDCAPAAPRLVERTIRVPEWSSETRTITVTECRPETRTRTVTHMRRVPYTEEVTRERRVLEQQQRTRIVNYTVRKPVMETATREYTVRVPYRVERQGTRNVCRMVPVQIERTIREDQGHWEEREVAVGGDCGSCYDDCCDDCGSGCGGRRGLFGWRRGGCGDCGGCGDDCGPSMARVWVPNVVERTVPVTVMRRKMEQQTYTYHDTEYRPERRTKQVQVCHYVTEPRSREVTETVCVPKMVTETHSVTRYRMEPESRTHQYTVMVPHQVQKEVTVPVCRMVEKTVTVNACEICGDYGCDDCDSGCGHGWGLFGGLFRRCW